ncbi:hypothetical protein KTJ06_11580 [Acinetobacter baumannii]|nr:hypothetical protein [Acinetobacter baumannii]EJB8491695.1 hypothetical protein [Acinetobacter baumannii]EJB8499504.1 hypothetical protein [Acinetobacter baumannii]MCT9490269.1 hypothetical protein [Acinetobacter baumannii]HEE5572931.1 hypothetical protein [Acinetobacter baumannii]
MLCVLNNTFFDGVMVMADDTDLKANHLHLLAQLRNLFTAVADVSVLLISSLLNKGIFYRSLYFLR